MFLTFINTFYKVLDSYRCVPISISHICIFNSNFIFCYKIQFVKTKNLDTSLLYGYLCMKGVFHEFIKLEILLFKRQGVID